jgi:exosome complex component CSL4
MLEFYASYFGQRQNFRELLWSYIPPGYDAHKTMALPSVALPGQMLGLADKYLPGPGTHIHDSKIYASIAGPVRSQASKTTKTPPLLSIPRAPPNKSSPGILGPSSGSGSPLLPEVNSIVLARVTRLGPRFASLEILIVGEEVCNTSFAAQIRREDIRATEKDKVKVEESFRVGDVVRGEVISLGDAGGYYVSTARNELGVVIAWGGDGQERMLVPCSWKEVMDPITGRRESRKVAKPF